MHRPVPEGDDHGVPDHGLETARAAREAHFDSLERAYEAGVTIATGTDLFGPDLIRHGENALELDLLVETVGMDEHDALQSATRVAARTVADDDLDTLEPGNHADVLALEDDPLADVSAVGDVAAVSRGCETVDPAPLCRPSTPRYNHTPSKIVNEGETK